MARKIAQNGALTPRMAGTLRKDSQNVEQINQNVGRNKFDLSYPNLMSLRFGEVRPFFYQQTIARDTLSHSSTTELWSMQMKSPLMSNLTGYKDYFYVPMKAILPNSFMEWFNNPTQADDVPDDVYCSLDISKLYWDYIELFRSVNDHLARTNVVGKNHAYKLLVALLNARRLFSTNNLFCQLGINTNTICDYSPMTILPGFPNMSNVEFTFDTYVDMFFASDPKSILQVFMPYLVANKILKVRNITRKKVFVLLNEDMTLNTNEFKRLYEDLEYMYLHYKPTKIAENYIVEGFKDWNAANSDPNLEGNYFSFIVSLLSLPYMNLGYYVGINGYSETLVDISPLIAYQMVGAQFFTNDQIDKVYTAQDWIDEMSVLVNYDYMTALAYDYNGHKNYYDVFSKKILDTALSHIPYEYGDLLYNDTLPSGQEFIYNLITPFNSLRYGDYFTGSRLNPLALGADPNSYAPVTASNVKSLDMVQAMSYLNYYNDIQKLGPTAWIQQNGIFGDFPSSLDPMPRFIQRSKFSIGEMQIENTSNTNTGEIISRSRSNDSGQFISIDIDEPSIVLGLISFDCPRIYTNVVDRLAFVKDRFDAFNPYFQNIGDQPILARELNLKLPADDIWSWTIRNTEYKQRVGVATGAFVGQQYLPSWAFTFDERNMKLDSDSIRNHDADLDKFFVSLPNISEAGYFHFYVRCFNNTEIVRAMQDRPDIQTPRIHR